MSQKTVKVKILGKTKEYPYGISYGEIVEEYQESSRYPIVLVMKMCIRDSPVSERMQGFLSYRTDL